MPNTDNDSPTAPINNISIRVFTPDVAASLFKMRTDQIDTAVIAESARWGEDQYGRIMTKDDNWQPSVDNIMNRFFPFRTNIVIRQLKTEELLSRYRPRSS